MIRKFENPSVCSELLTAEVLLDKPGKGRSYRIYTNLVCKTESITIMINLKTKVPDSVCAMSVASCIEDAIKKMSTREMETIIVDSLAYAMHEIQATSVKVTLRRSFNMLAEKIIREAISKSEANTEIIKPCVDKNMEKCVYAVTEGTLIIDV